MKKKIWVKVYPTRELAQDAFMKAANNHPQFEAHINTLTIETTTTTVKYESIHNTKGLRGLEIDRIWIDEITDSRRN